MHLGNLGISPLYPYQRLDHLTHHEDAVRLMDDGHSKPVLDFSERNRFEHLGNLDDLDDSVFSLQKAFHLTKNEYPAAIAGLESS
jgi:hypothetical protein